MAITGRAAGLALGASLVVLASPAPGVTLLVVNAALVALVVADAMLAADLRRLSYQRMLPRAGRLGEPLAAALLVHNGGRRRLRARVRDAWPPSAGLQPSVARVDVPPGQRRRLEQSLLPTRRGDRSAAAVTVRATGPLRLGARQRRLVVPGVVRVLPPFRSRRDLPDKLQRLRIVEGLVATRGAGRGTEFDSLREYVAGDDARTIDWRASARRQELQVRVFRPERDRRLVLLLDTGRTSAARVADEPRLDHALDAALLLAALAIRAGDRVDLVAADAAPRALVERADLAAMSDAMALLEPALLEADHGALVGQVLRLARRRCLVVLFTDLTPAVVEEGLLPVLPALARRHQVLVAALGDPAVEAMAAGRGSIDVVYAAAAAERTLAERRRVADLLRSRGAEVVDAPPAQFASVVADSYLSLKAAGRL